MLFDFSAGQYEFRDVVSAALARHASPSALRDVWERSATGVTDGWTQIAELGVFGMVISEDYEGLGSDEIDLALPFEQVGIHAVPGPIVETALVAARVVGRYGRDEVRAAWLPSIATGQAAFAVAAHHDALVAHAAEAHAVLAVRDDELHLVPHDSVIANPVESMDPTLRLARCEFRFDDSTVLDATGAAVEELRAWGAVGTASVLNGLSQRMLDLTRDYVLQREQFGRAIGSFQAIKHRLADVVVAIEAARGLAWYAHYALARLPEEAATASALAKASAGRAAATASAAALQLHGGIGFSWEHDLHLWMQRAKALETQYGTTTDHRDTLASHVLGH